MNKKINKREFLKQCAICTGGMALALNGIDAYSFKDKNGNVPIDIWKWHKLAHYYTKTDKGAQCGLCPNACVVPLAEKSICNTRLNFEGDLYSIAYGNPCSVYIDPIEKKPLFHFLPGTKSFSVATAGCNFFCLNCQNWQISQISPFDTENYDLMPDATVQKAAAGKCATIAFTYAEPVAFYEYAYDTSELAHKKGLKNALISNGYINEKPLRALAKYIDAANINLKSFNNDIYRKLNGGTLNPVLNTLKVLKEEGVWLEITNLIIPQWTDDLSMITDMCKWLANNNFTDTPLHFSRFFPMYKLTSLPSTSELLLIKARNIALEEGMKYVYIGNVPGTDAQHTYCPACKKIVVERLGHKILNNNLKSGKCSFCSALIHGVWN